MRTVAGICVLWCAALPAAGAAGNYWRMKRVQVVDQRGFERPMTALTLLIPVEWQFQGEVRNAPAAGCHANLVRVVFRAVSADDRLAIEMLPGNAWQWSDDPNSVRMLQASNQQMAQFGARGCDIQPPMTAADWLRRTVIPAVRRDARVLAVEPIPDFAQQVAEQARQVEQAAAQQGIRLRVRTDVGRARIGYTLDGRPVEEWLTAQTSSSAVPGPTFNVYTGQMGQAYHYSCAGEHVFGLRAPQGQLDAQERFFSMVLSTIHVDPQWEARVLQVLANLHATDAKGARDRSAIITKSGQDISRIINQTYENRNQSQDRTMAGWSQYMRGVETYKNPHTGDTVELGSQYGHA